MKRYKFYEFTIVWSSVQMRYSVGAINFAAEQEFMKTFTMAPQKVYAFSECRWLRMRPRKTI